MGKSLQDQLLNIGVASENQAKKVKADKRKNKKQKKKNNASVNNDSKNYALQVAREKSEKDKQLNEQKKLQAEKKALAAQIKQLIENNKMLQGDEDIPFHFVADDKVKTIYLNENIKKQIVKGQLAIVKAGKVYQVVALEIAEKIKQRDSSIVYLQDSEPKATDDDAYADYQVPDDLMW